MAERHAEIVKRFYRDLMAHGRTETAEALLAPGYADHDVSSEDAGRGGFVAWLREFDRAFRDRVVVLDDITVEGDHVSVRWIASATQCGEFMSFPPTREAVETSGAGVFRIEGGRIAERWNHETGLGLMEQLELRAARAERDSVLEWLTAPASRDPADAATH